MNLQNLPTELLIKIFQSIKSTPGELIMVSETLLNLTKVSKRFNEIISNEKSLMRYFTLKLTSENFNNEWIGSRRYQCLTIYTTSDDEIQEFMKVLTKIGGDILYLDFTFRTSLRTKFKAKTVVDILKDCPNVKIINEFPLIEDEKYDGEILELNLHSLSINANTTGIKLLQKTQTLKASFKLHSSEGFRDFLMKQKNLWSLSIDAYRQIWLDEWIAPNFPFSLHSLMVSSSFILDEEKFQEFLENHSKTLQEISFDWVDRSFEFLNLFSQCKNLRSLSIHQSSPMINFNGNYHLVIFDQIIELNLTFYESIKFDIAEIFPNLRKLCVRNPKGSSMRPIGKIERLEMLTLTGAQMILIPRTVRALSLKNVKNFPDMEEKSRIENLSIELCSNMSLLKNFLKNNKNRLIKIMLINVKLKMPEALALYRHWKKFGNVEAYNVKMVSMPQWLKKQMNEFCKDEPWFSNAL